MAFCKSEDLAGVAVVAIIASSAGLTAYELVERLLHPEKITHLPIVMIAAVVGAVGNEILAQYRIRVGSGADRPETVPPGAVLRAGTEKFWSWVRITTVHDDGQVHFRQISATEAKASGQLAETG